MADESGAAHGGLNLNLRVSSLVGACVLLIAAVALAYLVGVMRGRASLQHAENQKPAVTARLPAREAQNKDGSNKAAQTGEHNKILAPEDLQFARALKDKAPVPQQGKHAVPVAAPAEKYGPALPTAPRDAPPPTAMHDYVFQVAALRDEDSADALRQRLEGRGLRTRMQRSGKNLVIFVLLRGTEQRAAEIPGITEELHLGKPVLRSKKAATP
ncbi:MAG: hypothetical protein LBR31_05405 [Desulfovibrio sp.]|jgi:hypothetical protein|nr:hypothetical protein [Desulfovibrio sp.]